MTTCKNYNVQEQFKNNTLEEVQQISRERTLPFAVAAINITGDLNVGVMLRTACLMGAERFYIFGKRKYDKRSAVGSQNYLDVVKVAALTKDGELKADVVNNKLEQDGYMPLFFELGGYPLSNINKTFMKNMTKNPCLVFGNEGMGFQNG